MRRLHYFVDLYDTTHTPFHEIAYIIGRIIGYVLLAGIGFVIGQVLRGLCMAFFGW